MNRVKKVDTSTSPFDNTMTYDENHIAMLEENIKETHYGVFLEEIEATEMEIQYFMKNLREKYGNEFSFKLTTNKKGQDLIIAERNV